MAKTDYTGRINGDFKVLYEGEPRINAKGHREARWVCECQTCGTKELVLAASIRKNTHKMCIMCIDNQPEYRAWFDEKAQELNEIAERTGSDIRFTGDSFMKACHEVHGYIFVD